MADSITDVVSIQSQAMKELQQSSSQGISGTFGAVLKDSIQEVNKLQLNAGKAIENLAQGKVENVHEAMIAMEKASVSFNLMLEVKNKLISAYDEMMRMQV
jgi:flagellar hook-basal body complex protein FliE